MSIASSPYAFIIFQRLVGEALASIWSRSMGLPQIVYCNLNMFALARLCPTISMCWSFGLTILAIFGSMFAPTLQRSLHAKASLTGVLSLALQKCLCWILFRISRMRSCVWFARVWASHIILRFHTPHGARRQWSVSVSKFWEWFGPSCKSFEWFGMNGQIWFWFLQCIEQCSIPTAR